MQRDRRNLTRASPYQLGNGRCIPDLKYLHCGTDEARFPFLPECKYIYHVGWNVISDCVWAIVLVAILP